MNNSLTTQASRDILQNKILHYLVDPRDILNVALLSKTDKDTVYSTHMLEDAELEHNIVRMIDKQTSRGERAKLAGKNYRALHNLRKSHPWDADLVTQAKYEAWLQLSLWHELPKLKSLVYSIVLGTLGEITRAEFSKAHLLASILTPLTAFITLSTLFIVITRWRYETNRAADATMAFMLTTNLLRML